MKILYTLGNFVFSGHQVLLYTINAKNKNVEDFQNEAENCFAASFAPKNQMFKPMDELEGMDAEPPGVGDVIWTHTSGNQYIAAGIWQENPEAPVDFDALRMIAKSVCRKAKELNQLVVSIPLLTRNHDHQLWNFIYPIIEKEFAGSDVQVVCHIPTENELLQVLDTIGGEFNEFTRKPPEIRFVQNKE